MTYYYGYFPTLQRFLHDYWNEKRRPQRSKLIHSHNILKITGIWEKKLTLHILQELIAFAKKPQY